MIDPIYNSRSTWYGNIGSTHSPFFKALSIHLCGLSTKVVNAHKLRSTALVSVQFIIWGQIISVLAFLSRHLLGLFRCSGIGADAAATEET